MEGSPQVGQVTNTPRKRRSPLVAVLLSGLFPGLGQWYNGEKGKALLFAIGGVVTFNGLLSVDIDLDALATGLAKALLPFTLVQLWSVIDALRVARRSSAA